MSKHIEPSGRSQVSVLVVIAAYKEASVIASTVASVPKELPGVARVVPLVVNDGSPDATAQRAKEAGAVVVSHTINRGQGAALETGLEYARRNNFDIAVMFDADGQHDPSDMPAIIEPLLSGRADVALGSRFLGRAENISLGRKLTLKLGVLFTRILSRIQVTDTHNGYRALGRKALEKIHLTEDRMEHASEILELIRQHNLVYEEVPVTIRYTDYSVQKGQQSSQAFKIAAKMLAYKLQK